MRVSLEQQKWDILSCDSSEHQFWHRLFLEPPLIHLSLAHRVFSLFSVFTVFVTLLCHYTVNSCGLGPWYLSQSLPQLTLYVASENHSINICVSSQQRMNGVRNTIKKLETRARWEKKRKPILEVRKTRKAWGKQGWSWLSNWRA